jgi:hypothetical protein
MRLASAACMRCVQKMFSLLPIIGAQVSVDVTDVAEAAAIIGLVSSIVSLIDLSL